MDHFVQFYKDDAYLLDQVTGFIRAGLRAGDAVVVIAAKPRRDELDKRVRGDVTRAADGGQRRLRVFGEMVNLLATKGAHEAALRLEPFRDNLARVHPMSIFCGYQIGAFAREADGDAFRRVCNAHSRVSPAESYTPPANAQ